VVKAARMVTTDAEVDARQGAKAHDNDALARKVQYVPLLKLLIIGLSNGGGIALPIEGVPALETPLRKCLRTGNCLGTGQQSTGLRST
jgi:hypothetical protein